MHTVLFTVLLFHSVSYCNYLSVVKSRNKASVQYQQIIVGKISKDCILL